MRSDQFRWRERRKPHCLRRKMVLCQVQFVLEWQRCGTQGKNERPANAPAVEPENRRDVQNEQLSASAKKIHCVEQYEAETNERLGDQEIFGQHVWCFMEIGQLNRLLSDVLPVLSKCVSDSFSWREVRFFQKNDAYMQFPLLHVLQRRHQVTVNF